MRRRETMKEVKRIYSNLYDFGDVQYLLIYKPNLFYTTGIYGWNCDVYELDWRVGATCGYRPFGKKIDGRLLVEYDEIAKKIYYSDDDDKVKESKIDNLILKLLEEVEVA